jgi:hypothetical protein
MTFTIRRLVLGPPPQKVNPEPRVLAEHWINLQYAALCINELPERELIFDLRERTCPSCASSNWTPLARWLQEQRA